MSATSVGQIGLDLVVNQNQFNRQMAGVQSLAKKTGKLLVAAFGVNQLVKFSKQCIELSSDLQEVQNVADVAFPHMTAQMNEFAKSAASNFGLSETMAKKYSSLYGTMAKQFGFTESAAFEMGSTLAGLAGDVASFYNMTQDEAYTKLKSVFSGETETLKEIGVVMTQDALDAYALANGFDKTTKSMTEAEKVALRYSFVQNQLSAATGDFLRTSDSWANQTRLLKLNLEQLGSTIGGTFINAFKPLVSTLNVVIGKFTDFARVVSDSLGKIFGWEYQETGGGVASDLESGAGSAGDIASGIGTAAKNAEKLKRQIRDIDELSILSLNSESSSGTGATGGGSAGGSTGPDAGKWVQTEGLTEGLTKPFESVITDIEKLFRDIKIGDWFTVGEDTSNIISGIFNFFAKAIDEVDWYGIGTKIGDFLAGVDWTKILGSLGNLIWQAINAAIKLWAGSFNAAPIETAIITSVALLKWTGLGSLIAGRIAKAIALSFGSTPIITTITAGFQAMFGNTAAQSALAMMFGSFFSNPLTIAIAGLVAGIPTMFVGIYDACINGIDWLSGVLIPAGGAAAGAGIGAIVGMLGGPVGAGVGALIGLAVGLVTDGVILIVQKWDEIKEWFSGIEEWFSTNVVEPIKAVWEPIATWFDESIIQPVGNFFDGFATRVGQIFEGLWIIIQAVWIVVSDWFNEHVITPLVNFFTPIFEKVKGIFSRLWDGIKAIWSVVSNWFNEKIISPVKNAFKTACDAIGGFFSNLWSGIKKGVVGAMNSVISGIEKGINFLVSGINKIIKGFNKVVSWAAKVAEVDWGGVDLVPKVSLSRVPMLAQGGYVKANTPQLAIIGDNKHQGEVVAPEGKLEQMALKAARIASENGNQQMIALLQKQNELLEAILGKDINISGETIFNSVRKSADEYARRTGKPAFNYL